MKRSAITTRGGIILPASVRKKLGIRRGTKITFTERKGKLIIHPLDRPYFECLSGILGTEGKVLESLMQDKEREREL